MRSFSGSHAGTSSVLIYVSDIPQAVKSNLVLHADDLCLMYQHKDIAIMKKILNEDFENICDWFVDNKLGIRYGDDQTQLCEGLKILIN